MLIVKEIETSELNLTFTLDTLFKILILLLSNIIN